MFSRLHNRITGNFITQFTVQPFCTKTRRFVMLCQWPPQGTFSLVYNVAVIRAWTRVLSVAWCLTWRRGNREQQCQQYTWFGFVGGSAGTSFDCSRRSFRMTAQHCSRRYASPLVVQCIAVQGLGSTHHIERRRLKCFPSACRCTLHLIDTSLYVDGLQVKWAEGRDYRQLSDKTMSLCWNVRDNRARVLKQKTPISPPSQTYHKIS